MNEYRTHGPEDVLDWENDRLPIYKDIIIRLSLNDIKKIDKLLDGVDLSNDKFDNILIKKIENLLSYKRLNKYSKNQILYIHNVCSSITRLVENSELFSDLEILIIKRLVKNTKIQKSVSFIFYVISKLKNKKPPKELENLFEQIRKELNDKKWW
ncbi:MAG: hypothetical protein ACE5ES_05705 [Candidatus Nanoarchaeia archaeon]